MIDELKLLLLCSTDGRYTTYHIKFFTIARNKYVSITTVDGVTYDIPMKAIENIEFSIKGALILIMKKNQYLKFSSVMLDKAHER